MAASSEAFGFAMISNRARANAASPGLQLSLAGSSSARLTASSTVRSYFATSARASASVVGSGTVGPDAIADGSSCGTSEIASVTISAARWPARASRPPLIRDRCLRTMFISPIGAPERSSARFTCCFCANETPSAGAIQFAEPPPDNSTSNRSSAVASGGEAQRLVGGFQPGFVGHGMAGLDHPDPPRRHAVAVARGGKAGQPRGIQPQRIEIMPFGRGGHRGRALSGGKADHAAFRRSRQMRRQHDVGMCGRDGRIEDRTQEGTSVGHVCNGRGSQDGAGYPSNRGKRKPPRLPAGALGGPQMGRSGFQIAASRRRRRS